MTATWFLNVAIPSLSEGVIVAFTLALCGFEPSEDVGDQGTDLDCMSLHNGAVL